MRRTGRHKLGTPSLGAGPWTEAGGQTPPSEAAAVEANDGGREDQGEGIPELCGPSCHRPRWKNLQAERSAEGMGGQEPPSMQDSVWYQRGGFAQQGKTGKANSDKLS